MPSTKKDLIQKQFNELEKLKQVAEGSIETNNSSTREISGGSQTYSQLHDSTSHLNNLWYVKGRGNIDAYVGCFYFANGIDFNVCRSPYWKEMVRDLIDIAPKGYKPPSYGKMRIVVLYEEGVCKKLRVSFGALDAIQN